MAIRTSVSHTTYVISLREHTGDIIKFAQFEEGSLWSETHNLLAETCDDTEIDNKTNDDSTMLPLISEEEMDAMSSGDEYDAESMYT